MVNSLYIKKGGQCSFYCRFPLKSRFLLDLDTKNRVAFDTTVWRLENREMKEDMKKAQEKTVDPLAAEKIANFIEEIV